MSLIACIKNWKKILLFFIMSLLLFCTWGNGIYYAKLLQEGYQSVSVRMEKDKVTKGNLLRGIQNEKEKGNQNIPSVTAWKVLNNQKIKTEGSAGKITVKILQIYGDMRQVFPIDITSGNLLYKYDYDGCIIDEEVSYQLFHNLDTVGNIVLYKGKKYYIRGIIKYREPIVLIQSNHREAAYSNIELVFKNKENGRQLADNFILQNSLGKSYTIVDGSFYAGMLWYFSKFPAWLMGIYFCFCIIKVIWERRTIPLQAVLLVLLLILVWEIFQWLMEFDIHIPDCLLPTKWSDFTFWTEKYKDYQKHMEQITYLLPVTKDRMMISYISKCIGSIAITLMGLLVLITHKNVFIRENKAIPLSLFVVVIEGMAIFLLYKAGKEFKPTKGFLCIIPLFILVEEFRFWVKSFHEKVKTC